MIFASADERDSKKFQITMVLRLGWLRLAFLTRGDRLV